MNCQFFPPPSLSSLFIFAQTEPLSLSLLREHFRFGLWEKQVEQKESIEQTVRDAKEKPPPDVSGQFATSFDSLSLSRARAVKRLISDRPFAAVACQRAGEKLRIVLQHASINSGVIVLGLANWWVRRVDRDLVLPQTNAWLSLV